MSEFIMESVNSSLEGPFVLAGNGDPYGSNHGTTVSVRFSGTGVLNITPVALLNASDRVVFRLDVLERRALPRDIEKHIGEAVVARFNAMEDARLRRARDLLLRLIPNGLVYSVQLKDERSFSVPLTEDGHAPAVAVEVRIPGNRSRSESGLRRRLSFAINDTRAEEVFWSAYVRNLTSYKLLYRITRRRPSDLEKSVRVFNSVEVSRELERMVNLTHVLLDTSIGNITLDFPPGSVTKIDLNLEDLRGELGVALHDINSETIRASLNPDSRSPSGLALRLEIEFESDGFEGTLGETKNLILDGLSVALTVMLEFAPLRRSGDVGELIFDPAKVVIEPGIEGFGIDGWPDCFLSKDVLLAQIATGIRAAITSSRQGVKNLLDLLLFPVGIRFADTQVLSARRTGDGSLELSVIQRRTR